MATVLTKLSMNRCDLGITVYGYLFVTLRGHNTTEVEVTTGQVLQ